VSISPTFYVQLLRSYVPKAPKDTADLTVFFVLSGSICVKVVRGTNIDEIEPRSGNVLWRQNQTHFGEVGKHMVLISIKKRLNFEAIQIILDTCFPTFFITVSLLIKIFYGTHN